MWSMDLKKYRYRMTNKKMYRIYLQSYTMKLKDQLKIAKTILHKKCIMMLISIYWKDYECEPFKN